MGVGDILFKPQGRIGRKDFWIGWAIMFAANFLSAIPFVGIVISLGLIYVQVCVWGKRLHDMGKTAWLVLVPMLAPLAVIAVGAGLSISMSGGSGAYENALFTPVFFIACGLAVILAIGLLVWVGATPGQNGPNAYGPDPRAPMAGAAETFA